MAGLIKAAAAKRTNYPGTPAPAERQRWAACDKRGAARGRQLSTEKVDDNFVYGEVIEHGIRTGRRTKIRRDRMVPSATGWRYLGEETATATVTWTVKLAGENDV